MSAAILRDPDAEPERPPERGDDRLFRRCDWLAFAITFVASLAVYTYTLAPTVTLEDSGELVVAADHLGVPHPPGYPIWTMLAWIFTRIFRFVTWQGYPNPAWGVNFMSAFFGALACATTALLVSRSGESILTRMPNLATAVGERMRNFLCCVAAVTCGLLLAFTPGLWSQAVIAEVYSLNSFFLAMILLLTYLWMSHPARRKLLFLTAFLFGLSLTNHQTLGVILLALGIALLLKDLALFRDTAIVGSVFAAGITIAKEAARPGMALRSLQLGEYTTYIILFAAIMALCFLLAVRWREEMVTLALLFILVVCLVVLFAKAAKEARMHPFPPEFPAVVYGIAFLGQLAIVVALSIFLPKGKVFAAVVLLMELLLVVLLRQGVLHGLVHPTSAWFYFYMIVLNAFVLGLAWFLLPSGKTVALVVLCIEIGLAFYMYLPLASERNPPMNWGYPRTWEGFKHAVSRGQYEKISPAHVLSGHFFDQIGTYLSDLRRQFTLMVAIVGFLPFAAWRLKIGRFRFKAFYMALLLAMFACFLIGLEEIVERATDKAAAGGLGTLSDFYRALLSVVVLLLVVGLVAAVVRELVGYVRRLFGAGSMPREERVTLAVVLIGAALVVLGGALFLMYKMVGDKELDLAPVHRISISLGIVLLAVLAGVITWLFTRGKFEIDIDPEGTRWLLVTVVAFVSLSFMLVVVINPKQDIQSQFINRVFFIQSHGVYAIWIGYGFLFSLAFAHRLLRNALLTRTLGVACVIVTPLLPIWNNRTNKSLIKEFGGAEQNGHDFGWQFGHYQLMGAEAIARELGPDESLPNPQYPPAMGTNAVFFGGTDPGRFVPTYQIFCPKDRPDVFLITQNALADNTYMAVMRDLYGDKIWIPSIDDSNRAFREYVRNYKAGQRHGGADVNIDHGRVSVKGVQGVMQINGILAKAIFEHNKFRHEFFVEESYVIEWMYPYLTPHGLIMKINPEPLPKLPDDVVKNDRAFWDWYAKRLLDNPKFRRDVVARKTFSKLRGAIAGVYAYRKMWEHAEYAFNQAKDLYPLSPEANFRLADVYMRQLKYPKAVELMEAFEKQDPMNEKVTDFINRIKSTTNIDQQRKNLEHKLFGNGKANIEEVLRLAEIYRRTGKKKEFENLTRNILANTNTPPPVYLRLARMYADEKRVDLLNIAFRQYLRRKPDDARVWCDLAAVSLALRKQDEALRAVKRAVQLGGEPMRKHLMGDRRFDSVRGHKEFKRLLAPPGG